LSQIQKEIKIINKLGLHARAAAKLVQLASTFASDIVLARAQREVNAKSIMGVMMLAASQGATLTIRANGADAQEAVERIEALVENRFGEQE